jgi:hypothetical protein
MHLPVIRQHVAKHGVAFAPRPLADKRRRRGAGPAALRCVAASQSAAVIHNLAYVEGFALAEEDYEPQFHAWNLDGGRVVDTSWDSGVAYLGVVIDAAEVRRVMHTWGVHVPILPHLLGVADAQTGLSAG